MVHISLTPAVGLETPPALFPSLEMYKGTSPVWTVGCQATAMINGPPWPPGDFHSTLLLLLEAKASLWSTPVRQLVSQLVTLSRSHGG